MSFLPGHFPSIMGDVSPAIKLNGSDERLHLTAGSNSADRRFFTWNFWVWVDDFSIERRIHTADNGPHGGIVRVNTSGQINLFGSDGITPGNTHCNVTSSLTLNAAAWNNVHIRYDTTQAAGSRCLFTINNVADTSETVSTDPSGTNSNWGIGSLVQSIAYDQNANTFYAMKLARFYFVDDQSLAASNFVTAADGVLRAVDYVPTFSNCGFLLDFGDPSDLGNDPLNGNDFTLVNVDSTNYLTNGPPRTT